MYVELQLTSEIFGRLFENQLKANQPCLTYMEFDVLGQVFVMDKIEIVDPTNIQRDPGTPRQNLTLLSYTGNIAQPTVPYFQVKPTLAITLMKKSDLLANGANPSSPAALLPTLPAGPINIQPVFDVSVYVSGDLGAGGPVKLAYSLFDVDYGLLGSAVPPDVDAKIRSALTGLTLPPVTMDFSDLLKALGEDSTIVYNCGIACDTGQTLVALRIEFQRETDSIPMFTSFFTDGPANRLQPGWDWAMFVDQRLLVQQATETIKTALTNASDFNLTSGPDGSWSGSGIDVSLRGTALGACKATGGDIDMKATLTVTSSVPSANVLRTHLHLDVSSTDFFQVAVCSAVSAVLWPFLGLLMTGTDSIKDIAEYIGLLLLTPLFRMMVVMFAIETSGVPEDLSSDLGKNWHKIDDDNYESDDPLDPSKLSLPGLGAQLEFDSSTPAADGMIYGGKVPVRASLAGSVIEFNATPFTWKLGGSCQTFFTTTNYATIFVAVNEPAKLCYGQLLGTPPADYTLTQKDNTLTVAPILGADPAAPVLPTEPCLVFMATTDGVRIITFQPPVAETETQKSDLRAAGVVARGNCYKLTKLFTVLDKIHWVEQVDPEGSLQGWHVVVENVHGQTVEVQNEQSHLLMTAHASSMGVAQMVLLLDQAHFTKSISIRLAGRAVDEQSTLNVAVQQVLFALRSTVNAPDPLTQLAFAGAVRDARLMAVSPSRSSVWSVKAAAFPVLQQSLVNKGCQSGLIVHAGASISDSLSTKARVAIRSAWGRAHDYSVVGSPRVDGVQETLYLGSETRGTLWDVSNPQKPTVLQVFHSVPWFVGTASSGKLLARRRTGSRLIDVYQAVAEHQR